MPIPPTPTADDLGRNLRRARVMAGLTQDTAAKRAGLSRVAYRNLESGASRPRSQTLEALAQALRVRIGELLRPPAPRPAARFRSSRRIQGREEILEAVALQLEAYTALEALLDRRVTYGLSRVASRADRANPRRVAAEVRDQLGLGDDPIWDIAGLLEEAAGIKVTRLSIANDMFFGLSIAADGLGPAVAVNTWDRISVERWIFTAAHELGHLVLHGGEFDASRSDEDAASETEANLFASHFLMPRSLFEKEWSQSDGLDLWSRVMKVKEIFRVSYKTVLYRVQDDFGLTDIWPRFQMVANHRLGHTLKKADEPASLPAEAFSSAAPETRRAREPIGLPPETFTLDRRAKLVREAVLGGQISTARGAEILGLGLREMRQLQSTWI